MEYEHIIHPFEPVFDERSEVLILGSLPSVKSREYGFYYGHPRNRLWSVLAELLGEPFPQTAEDRKKMLLKHRIAMWDVIYECDIKGSDDASVRNAVPCDIGRLTEQCGIRHIFLNGKTAGRLYEKHLAEGIALAYSILPSTSPANAAYTFERLLQEWKKVIYACK